MSVSKSTGRSWQTHAVSLATTAALGCAPPSAQAPNPCGQGAYPAGSAGVCLCEPGHHGDPEVECPPHEDVCAQAEQRLSHRVCTHTVDDEAQWTQLSVGGGPAIGGLRRLGKYLAPASSTARLPTLFSDANSYRLHFCLMSAGFEPLFPGLTTADYARLIMTHAGREFYAGSVYEFQDPDPVRFGFSIETALRPEQMLPPETVYAIYQQLSDRFALGELGYLPRGTLQEQTAQAWIDPPFPVLSAQDDGVTLEVYTPGIAFGRVRLHHGGEPHDFGWQDIVVFDQVPIDLEGVVGAAVTGQRQDILSHLNVLSAQRGTPNFFVDEAIAAFSPHEGQLVRVEAEPGTYKVRPATEDEAEAYWAQQRPAAEVENPAQLDYEQLDSFTAIPTATPQERALARARFGAKTVGLATLAPLIDTRYQTPGLGVPFHYYDEFMTTNSWSIDLGEGPQAATYAETIAAWLDDDQFRTNASVRKERLAALREQMRSGGVVSPTLTQALRERIIAEFGSDTVMVRIRSSSNAEDTPTFNGAGLYDSTSACAADSVAPGPPTTSACDPSKELRTLERALAKVWASLWNFGAFEEREYYQLDHRQIAMGATVSLRFEDERANGVAFTGDPVDPRRSRFTVNAQAGEIDVVSPTPGITAELTFLTIDDGEVVEIERAVESSLVPNGQPVVSEDHLEELGGLMAELEQIYPVDDQDESLEDPILDLEFKVTHDDALVIKQIRTFVPVPYASDPTCRQ
ncbi:MAG: PEP/pyruvate-binding domain-containing protein [Myxococcota bacterium]